MHGVAAFVTDAVAHAAATSIQIHAARQSKYLYSCSRLFMSKASTFPEHSTHWAVICQLSRDTLLDAAEQTVVCLHSTQGLDQQPKLS